MWAPAGPLVSPSLWDLPAVMFAAVVVIGWDLLGAPGWQGSPVFLAFPGSRGVVAVPGRERKNLVMAGISAPDLRLPRELPVSPGLLGLQILGRGWVPVLDLLPEQRL